MTRLSRCVVLLLAAASLLSFQMTAATARDQLPGDDKAHDACRAECYRKYIDTGPHGAKTYHICRDACDRIWPNRDVLAPRRR